MKNNTWIQQPSRKQVVIVSSIWFFGIICLLIAQTNFFTESLFQGKYFVTHTLMAGSTLAVVIMFKNYFKHKKVLSKNQH